MTLKKREVFEKHISLFNFGTATIRVIPDFKDGQPYFVAKDVAVALGFKNVAVAIRNLPHKVIITRQELICQKHTRGSELTQTLFQANGQYRTTLIPESDLYRLVMRDINNILTN